MSKVLEMKSKAEPPPVTEIPTLFNNMMYVEGKLQCCGANLDKWDGHELEAPDSAAERRCSHPMWRFHDNGTERIPLCAGHYAWWSCTAVGGGPELGDGTSPIWLSPEWYETYEDAK